MDATTLGILANMGFAAVAFFLIWPAYRDVNKKLLDVIDQNSKALTESASAMKEVAKGQENMQVRMGRMDDRLLVLEEQHKQIRECPLGASREKGGS